MPPKIKTSEEKAFDKFKECWQSYKEIREDENLEDIFARQLPKICINPTSERIIQTVDKILEKNIDRLVKTILDLHSLIYCGAKTVTELCKEEDVEVYNQREIPVLFPNEDQKKLYRNSKIIFRRLLFTNEKPFSGPPPTVKKIEDYWAGVWEEQSKESNDMQFVISEERRVKVKSPTSYVIEENDLKKALKTRKNWSPAGIDGLQVFWYKCFPSIRKVFLAKINYIIEKKEEMPAFFTVGFTKLSPKDKDTENPAKYRPITNLPTIYKIISRCVYQKVFHHYENNDILAQEQCGGRKGCFGVRKALIMDTVALAQDQVHGYYVDFQKAFDSVSHAWILKMLRVYKVDEKLVDFLQLAMSNWKTRVSLESDLTRPIAFKRGVFQGDPMSVLLFWTALNPLSFHLRKMEKGLCIGDGHLSHVLYMDDLKLYAENREDVSEMKNQVDIFAKSIGMKINESKTYPFSIPADSVNEPIPQAPVYLGYTQNPRISSDKTIRSKLNTFKKKCQRIETTTISEEEKKQFRKLFLFNPIINSFGVLEWTSFEEELKTIYQSVSGRKRFLNIVKKEGKSLDNISCKLINELCIIRRKFYKDAEMSKMVEHITKNDTMTPLQLSLKDEKEYVVEIITKIKNNN